MATILAEGSDTYLVPRPRKILPGVVGHPQQHGSVQSRILPQHEPYTPTTKSPDAADRFCWRIICWIAWLKAEVGASTTNSRRPRQWLCHAIFGLCRARPLHVLLSEFR